MAEALKNRFGTEIIELVGGMIGRHYREFDHLGFASRAAESFLELELMDRGSRIAETLRLYLPTDYPVAVEILERTLLGEPPTGANGEGGTDAVTGDAGDAMYSFRYLPFSYFIQLFGVDHPRESLRVMHVLTQRFTAEFCIRPFLEQHTAYTLGLLSDWAGDESADVRRLVSEGTRPRLPWASQLMIFRRDPRPVIELLEVLKDDPSEYVRRSVANNLNDIGKDNPEIVLGVCRRWIEDAGTERTRLVRHALRSLVKAGNQSALAILGYTETPKLHLRNVVINPQEARIGASVVIGFVVELQQPTNILVDLRLHYLKADGTHSPKVFKLGEVSSGSAVRHQFRKKISLAEMTTRRHYPGLHHVEALINGCAYPLGSFALVF